MLAEPQRRDAGADRRAAAPRRARLAARGGAPGISRSYSIAVGILKYLLPAIALGIVAVVALWPELQRNGDAPPGGNRPQPVVAGGEALNPRYFGVDDDNQPYSVTASVASQDGEVVEMELPEASITLADGTGLALTAAHGRLDRGAEDLALGGGVVLVRDDGTRIETETVAVDLEAQSAEGDRPVSASGPFGTMEAAGFRVEQRGAVVVFTGPAVLKLNRDAGEVLRP